MQHAFTRRFTAPLGALLSACGSDQSGGPPPVAVLSAFPGEVRPLLAQATIDDTVTINGHVLRVGTLGGVRVVIGLTGIGLANATNTTRELLEHFRVRGIVISAVAGSALRIADVAVPETWTLKDGSAYAVNDAWLALARTIAAPGAVALAHCTPPVPDSEDEPVCLPFEPAIVVGGLGRSDDPFPTVPSTCQPGGGDVLGCDVDEGAAAAIGAERDTGAAAAESFASVDMETAAIAREAATRGVPFIAFRGVSDGEGDPLGLPGFPLQFIVYYRLAAHNAAAATVAFLERLAHP
jgi:nucleoside phosphorylase